MLKLPKSTLKLITMVKGYQKKEPVLLHMLPGERLGGREMTLSLSLLWLSSMLSQEQKKVNPCDVSGIDYVKAIIAGKSHLKAEFPQLHLPMHSMSLPSKANPSRTLHAVMLPRLSLMLFQRSQILPMLLLSMLSWIRYLKMMLQLLTQSASHL